jgi:hypothetical protein
MNIGGLKMNKIKTCKYNRNRHCSDVVYPFCTWTPKDEVYPPHLYWSMRIMTEDDCYECEVYEKVEV